MENSKNMGSSELSPRGESWKITPELFDEKQREIDLARENARLHEKIVTGQVATEHKDEYEGTPEYQGEDLETSEEAQMRSLKEISNYRAALQEQRKLEDEYLDLLEAANRQ